MSDYRDQKKYYPTMVSEVSGQKQVGEGFRRMQIIQGLPDQVKNILLSDEIVDFIYAIEQRYKLLDLQTEDFSRLVRKYFFKEISEKDFVYKIASLCKIRPEEGVQILRKILAITPNDAIGEKPKNIKKMTLAVAMAQFPSIKDQLISDKPIITKPFLQPLQPSIKNWIMVYEKILGVSKHDTIERGEFVFRSEATRNMDHEAREQLAVILKSRDEDVEVSVDMDQKKIIFNTDDVDRRVNTTQEKKEVTMTPTGQFTQGSINNTNAKNDVFNGVNPRTFQGVVGATQKQQSTPHNKNPHNALEMEIMKNRADVKKGIDPIAFSVKKTHNMMEDHEREKSGSHDVGIAAQNNHIRTSSNNTVQGQSVTAGIDGKIDFSSNHSLPVEKSEKKELKATNAYHMKPIGGAHVLKKQKKIS